jgi:pimeloyl-ACP methyl ester carboxylesterase
MNMTLTLLSLLFAAMSAGPEPAATQFVTASDGTRIAYDVTGSGPAVMLLHGGGQTRRAWHDAGYVSQLASAYTVVTVDLRGNGDSGKPTAKAAYAIDRMVADLVAVADAAHLTRFTVWGFSYGANVGRYLAARSDRVVAMVYIGIPFGPPVDPNFRRIILQRLEDGTAPPVVAAWTGALLEYPPVEPGDMRCPTLWVVGTRNTAAYDSAKDYDRALAATRVRVVLLEGLTHPQELERIDRLLPKAVEFMREVAR